MARHSLARAWIWCEIASTKVLPGSPARMKTLFLALAKRI
jgi:hypothetical protein